MKSCPIATQDIHVNLKNRNNAIQEYGYGPANPNEPNTEFWAQKERMWKGQDVKNMRCGNCAAFIQTKQMLDCIVNGIDEEGEEGYAPDVVDAANLGYCELFEFKCAGDRTCDAWLMGGPITREMTNSQKNMLAMAKIEAKK